MVDDESGSEDFRIQVEVVDDSGRLLLDDPPYPEGLTRAISLASDDAIIGHDVRRLEARVAVDDDEVIHALHPVSYTHLTLPTKERCRSRWSPYH